MEFKLFSACRDLNSHQGLKRDLSSQSSGIVHAAPALMVFGRAASYCLKYLNMYESKSKRVRGSRL